MVGRTFSSEFLKGFSAYLEAFTRTARLAGGEYRVKIHVTSEELVEEF